MRCKNEIQNELDWVWSKLDNVLDKFWKELNGENRSYKINNLTRKRERLIKLEAKLLRELSRANKRN